MKIKAAALLIFIGSLFFSGACGVSYPKETLARDLEAKVFKESGAEAKVYLTGQTLYLDLILDDLVSPDRQKVYDATMKMQSGLAAITRVVLSSDAEVKYMTVSAFDSKKNILLRAVMSIKDVKDYFYYRISHEDYMSRNIFEIEAADTAAASAQDRHDISDNEFVGRMVVSRMNMVFRQDPNIGALLFMLQLRYAGADEEGVLILSAASDIDTDSDAVISAALAEETKKYSQKYGIRLNKIRLMNRNNNSVAEIQLEV